MGYEHKQIIYDLFISKMVSRSFSRHDVAFDTDTDIDLSSYYAYMSGQQAQMKKTIFYDKNGSPETKYFGTRKSDRYIRIYEYISYKRRPQSSKSRPLFLMFFETVSFEMCIYINYHLLCNPYLEEINATYDIIIH